MRQRLLAAAAAVLFASGAAEAPLPAPPTAPAVVRTPAQAAADRLIAALNGDGAARAAFVADGFSARALAAEPAAARTARLDALAQAAGGFDVISTAPQGERMVEVVAASRRGGRFARFVVFVSGKEPGKLSDLFVMPARDPVRAGRDAWPEGGVAESRLPAEIDRRVKSLVEEDAFSGAVLVARGDRVVYRRAYGLADQGWKQPNTPETAFHVASIGKMFTAAAVLKLAEQGKLSLDDTLAKWVPEYPDQALAAKISLRQLLTHTSGLPEWDGRRLPPGSAADAARTMTGAPLFEPGAHFAYSNAGYVLLGAVIEKATARPLDQALKALVWGPAGMKRTGLFPVTAVVPDRARGYLRPEDDPLGFGPRYSNEQFLGFRGDGSGGEYSTVDDLFAFHRALAANRLLAPATTAELLADRTDFPGAPRPWRYGYGVRLTSCAGTATFGHSGGGPNSGVSDATYAALDGSFTVIVLTNYDPDSGENLALALCEAMARQPH